MRLHRVARERLLAVLVLFGPATTGTAAPVSVDHSHAPVVALAASASDHPVLIKAYSDALFRSVTDGREWTPISLPDAAEQGRVSVVAMTPNRPETLYVAGPGLGVLRSSDGGKTWSGRNDGLPSRDVIAFALHAEQPDTLYAYVAGHGIFRSEDAGRHWRLMDAGPRDKIAQLVHSNMPGSMQTGWLFAGTSKGVGRSMDCFCGWRDAGALRRPVDAVTFEPNEPQRVYAATVDGLFASADGGETWSSVRTPERVTAMTATSSAVIIATAGESALYRSTDHGNTWHRVGG